MEALAIFAGAVAAGIGIWAVARKVDGTLPERIARWLSPCLHEFETIATLHDREDNPTAATVVQVCKVCGDRREHTFRAPASEGCPPHRWVTEDEKRLIKDGDEVLPAAQRIPIGKVIYQRCSRCGDVRVRTLKT